MCDGNWVDATADHIARVFNGESLEARFRDKKDEKWTGKGPYGNRTLRGWVESEFVDDHGTNWKLCQVYCEPAPQESVEPVPTEKKHSGLDQASLSGAEPIEVRPIMQIRLPVAASVIGALSGVFEKHYPGSVMRQAGDYLIFEEPIEL